MSHPPTRSSLEGSGRRARPCHPSRLPLIRASHSSGLGPQPPSPSPAWTFRRARSWRAAPHLPAAGHSVSSAWNVPCTYTHKHSRMPTHVHTNPRAHTHPMCIHACVHTHVCPHVHTHVHTHTHTHMHCSFPWPFGPQPGACSPAGLRPSTAPTVAPSPTPSSFLHIPRGSSSVTAGGVSSELGPGARVGLWALVPWAEGGPLSARGWDRPWPPSWHCSCWVGSGLTLRGPGTPHWRLSRGPQAGPQVSDLRVSSQPGAAATRTPGSLGGAWGTPVPALLEASAPGLRPGQGQLPAGPGL